MTSNAGYIVEPHYEWRYCFNKEEIEMMIVDERLYLYNRSLACRAKALKMRLGQWGINNAPSTINRILSRNCLTNNRNGYYPGDYK
jgi:hypothetical protein